MKPAATCFVPASDHERPFRCRDLSPMQAVPEARPWFSAGGADMIAAFAGGDTINAIQQAARA